MKSLFSMLTLFLIIFSKIAFAQEEPLKEWPWQNTSKDTVKFSYNKNIDSPFTNLKLTITDLEERMVESIQIECEMPKTESEPIPLTEKKDSAGKIEIKLERYMKQSFAQNINKLKDLPETTKVKISLKADGEIMIFDMEVSGKLDVSSKECIFYSNDMLNLLSTPSRRLDKTPFYIITYDFLAENQGPIIYRHKKPVPGSGGGADTLKVKKSVWVGRNSSFTFIGKGHGFDRFEHTLSFRDYHQEDGEAFRSIISSGMGTQGSPETQPPSTKGPVEVVDGDPIKSDSKLKALDEQLSELLMDNQRGTISPTQFTLLIDFVHLKISECFGVGLSDSQKFIDNFKTEKDKQKAKAVLFKMFAIESLAPKKLPPFKIGDHDALISKVEYYDKDQKVYSNYPEKEIPILGGFKIDFSTGIIGSNLVDRTYFSQDAEPRIDSVFISEEETRVDTVEMKVISRENVDKYQIGFGIFAHFYSRLTPYANLAFTTGFILRDNLAFQFPVGVSALIGRKSRLVISYGLTFGQTKVLSAKYEEGVPIEATRLTNVSDSQLTSPQSGRGHFFGLTYNFARIRPNN